MSRKIVDDIKRLMYEQESISTYKEELKDGFFSMTTFPIVPGIILALNQISASYVPFDSNSYINSLYTINYCLAGRCEFKYSENNVSYITTDNICVGKKHKLSNFSYPLKYYKGFEIYFFDQMFTKETRLILETFTIDFDKLFGNYKNDENPFIGITSSDCESKIRELTNYLDTDNIGMIRIKVLEFIHLILDDNNLIPITPHLITQRQGAMAKKAHDILTADLSKHIPIKKIASDFGISETSLKNYFKEVYGVSISEYLNDIRMKQAAMLLNETDYSILQIANQIGYTNQGRFAKVFYNYYHKKPLEYRHASL